MATKKKAAAKPATKAPKKKAAARRRRAPRPAAVPAPIVAPVDIHRMQLYMKGLERVAVSPRDKKEIKRLKRLQYRRISPSAWHALGK